MRYLGECRAPAFETKVMRRNALCERAGLGMGSHEFETHISRNGRGFRSQPPAVALFRADEQQ